MKKAIEKLRMVYPKLTVHCFSDFGHGDILNHPALLAEKLKNEIIKIDLRYKSEEDAPCQRKRPSFRQKP